jgi:hypothetical protein
MGRAVGLAGQVDRGPERPLRRRRRKAVFLLLGIGKDRGVPFLLRKNGVETGASLHANRKTA